MKFLFTLLLGVFCFAATAAPVGPVNMIFKNQYGEETIGNLIGGNFGSAYLSSTVTLSAAQVIALNATPITIVPAVSGKVIHVSSCKMVYTKGSAAFTVGTGSDVIGTRYHGTSVIANNINETGFIDQSSAKTADVFGGGNGGVTIRGVAVEIYSNAADVTVGTGSTVAISCFYGLH